MTTGEKNRQRQSETDQLILITTTQLRLGGRQRPGTHEDGTGTRARIPPTRRAAGVRRGDVGADGRAGADAGVAVGPESRAWDYPARAGASGIQLRPGAAREGGGGAAAAGAGAGVDDDAWEGDGAHGQRCAGQGVVAAGVCVRDDYDCCGYAYAEAADGDGGDKGRAWVWVCDAGGRVWDD